MTAFSQNVPLNVAAGVTPRRATYSWGAIIAGVIMTLGIWLLFGVLGAAVGLSVLGTGSPGEAGMGLGAMIWCVASGLVALFFGGFIAGRFSGLWRRADGLWHGAIMWSLAAIAAVLMISALMGPLVPRTTNAGTSPMAHAAGTAEITPPAGQTGAELRQTAAYANDAVVQAAHQAQAGGLAMSTAWGIFALLLPGLITAMLGGAAGISASRELPRTVESTKPGLAA